MKNKNNPEIEHDSMDMEYGEEVMCAGWNPSVDLVPQQHLSLPTERQMNILADLAAAEMYLKKMYSCQR